MEEHEDFGYSRTRVRELLGLDGHRGFTFADLISKIHDPGGDFTWKFLEQDAGKAGVAFAARACPPDSKLAVLYYDFTRAMNQLTLLEQAVLSLTVMGFDAVEIAAVIDPDGVLERWEIHAPWTDGSTVQLVNHGRYQSHGKWFTSRKLENRRRRIARLIDGRPKKDADGNEIRDENGDLVRSGGATSKLTRLMNGG